MATIKIREFKKKKDCAEREETFRAYQVVEYAHESCHALYEAFIKLRAGCPESNARISRSRS